MITKPFLFFSLLALFVSGSIAQDKSSDFTFDPKTSSVIPKYVGKVVLLRGKAEILSPSGVARNIKKGMKVYKGETIKTQNKSLVKVRLVDTTMITVGVKSEMKFDQFEYKTKKDRNITLNLIKGQLRSNFKIKSKKKDQLKVKVGHVSMGIRGTRILANKRKLANGGSFSQVALLSGKAKVYDSKKDENYDLNPSDTYTSVLNNQTEVVNHQKEKLSAPDLRYLKAEDKDPGRYFRPFLPYPKNLALAEKDLQALIQEEKALKKKIIQDTSGSSQRNKKSWKNTLKKLNEKLQDSEDD